MTGPALEEKYGLERAEASAANWRAHGVHPTENRALVEGEDGYENLRGVDSSAGVIDVSSGDESPNENPAKVETATAGSAPQTTSAPRASDQPSA
jgi:hypothetical protein